MAMMVLTIDVPMSPPRELTPNRRPERHPHQWFIRKRRQAWKDAWYLAAYGAVCDAGRPNGFMPESEGPFFSGPVRCRITIDRPTRAQALDPDNALSVCKHGLDQLQRVGVIANDRDLVFEPIQQVRSPDGIGRTVVELWQE